MGVRVLWRFAVLAVLIAALLAGCGGSGETTTTDSSTTSTRPATTSTAPTTTSTATTAPALASTTSAPQPVPPAVTVVTAGPAGGSGEVAVDWEAVAGATGYRVARSTSPSGPFAVTADLNLAAGAITVAADVVNVWSPGAANYHPTYEVVPGAPPPDEFQYVDSGGTARYYQVVAYNAAGDGPPSVVVCGAPPGITGC
jgi:hypothetical protein